MVVTFSDEAFCIPPLDPVTAQSSPGESEAEMFLYAPKGCAVSGEATSPLPISTSS